MIGQYVRNLSDDSQLSHLAVDMIKYADQFDEKKTVGQKPKTAYCLQYVVRFRSHAVKQRVQMSHSFVDCQNDTDLYFIISHQSKHAK